MLRAVVHESESNMKVYTGLGSERTALLLSVAYRGSRVLSGGSLDVLLSYIAQESSPLNEGYMGYL